MSGNQTHFDTRAYAALTAVAAFAVYASFICPTVSNRGDCGELAAASHTLGIAHPSGYPLYLILGKAFSYLPLGSIILRFNLMSAVFAALTVAVVFLAALRLTGNNVAAFLSSFCFALAPTFWTQAEFAEVYTLNAFFVASILYAAICWSDGGDERWAATAALLFGLGLANHMTVLMLCPALLILYVTREACESRLALASLFVLLGALVYVYLPVRASRGPILDGGYVTESLGFIRTVMGTSYLSDFLKNTSRTIESGIGVFVQLMLFNIHLLLPVGIMGAIHMWRRSHSLSRGLLLGFVVFPPFYILYGQPGVHYFLIPSILIFAIWIAVGWDQLTLRAPSLLRGPAIPAVLVVAQLFMVHRVCDARNDTISGKYAESILRHVGLNATLIANDDILAFPLYYYLYAENVRPDIKLVFNHKGPVWRKTIRDDWNRGPIYTLFWYDSLGESFTLLPDGPVGRVVTPPLPPPDEHEFKNWPRLVREFQNARLLRFAIAETDLAPRHLTTVKMLWELKDGQAEDFDVVIRAQLRGSDTAREPAALMRIAARKTLFEESWPLGGTYAGRGRISWGESKIIAHSSLLTVPEDAQPGMYALRVDIRKKGGTQSAIKDGAQELCDLKIWSIRGSTSI